MKTLQRVDTAAASGARCEADKAYDGGEGRACLPSAFRPFTTPLTPFMLCSPPLAAICCCCCCWACCCACCWAASSAACCCCCCCCCCASAGARPQLPDRIVPSYTHLRSYAHARVLCVRMSRVHSHCWRVRKVYRRYSCRGHERPPTFTVSNRTDRTRAG